MLSAHLVHTYFLQSIATTSHNSGSVQQVCTCTWVACLTIGIYKHIATATLPLTLVFAMFAGSLPQHCAQAGACVQW